MKNTGKVLSLFLDFLKFGCFTFGGGWSIIAQMQKTYIEERKEITQEELLDIVTIGRSLPGIMIGNVSVIFGYLRAGAAGSAACCIGMCIPPVIIMMFVTYFYTYFHGNSYMAAAMTGVRAAVVPIVFSAVAGMLKGSFRLPPCIIVAVVSFILYTVFDVSIVVLVLMGAAAGLLISSLYDRKDPGTRDGQQP